MRALCLLVVVIGCGKADDKAAASTRPLVLVKASSSQVLGAVTTALEREGMRVQDAADMENAMTSLLVGNVGARPPQGIPPATAKLWTEAMAPCRPLAEKCSFGSTPAPECEQLFQCTQRSMPSLRESWIRELGAIMWIEVAAGAQAEVTFFAKATGHRLCELRVRELRAGAGNDFFTSGSDAPVPTSLDAAVGTAATLAVAIIKGEGTAGARPLGPRIPPPADDAALAKLLGCEAAKSPP